MSRLTSPRNLNMKLKPILGPSYPTPGVDGKADGSETSELAQFIERSADGVYELVYEVNSIKSRVEL
jgi:hypothetical protein